VVHVRVTHVHVCIGTAAETTHGSTGCDRGGAERRRLL
jgi:hypothetical protein